MSALTRATLWVQNNPQGRSVPTKCIVGLNPQCGTTSSVSEWKVGCFKPMLFFWRCGVIWQTLVYTPFEGNFWSVHQYRLTLWGFFLAKINPQCFVCNLTPQGSSRRYCCLSVCEWDKCIIACFDFVQNWSRSVWGNYLDPFLAVFR